MTMIYTSLAWGLLMIGVAAMSIADANGQKLAIGLWFATAIAVCLYTAWSYS